MTDALLKTTTYSASFDVGPDLGTLPRLIGTCKDCRHWGSRETYSPGARPCMHTACRIYFVNSVPHDGIGSYDENGDQIITGPDFGCIHFDTK